MAIVLTRPDERASAYSRLQYSFYADKYPNIIAGETMAILNIAKPTAAEISLHPEFDADDVRVQHGTIPAGVLTVGQHIKITGTTNGLYTPNQEGIGFCGIWKVKKVVTNNYTVIDAAYEGDETGGTIGKYYHNFHIKVDLYNTNTSTLIDTFRVYPVGEYILSTFSLDVQDTIKRQLGPTIDPLQDSDPSYATTSWRLQGNGTSHIDYNIRFREVYDVPSDGINVLTEQAQVTDSTTLHGINMIRPLVQYRNRSLSYDYTQTIDSIFLVQDPVVSGVGRFLTNAPLTQNIGRDQFAQLEVMTDDEACRLVIKTYPEKNAGGTIIGTTNTNVASMDTTEMVYVGTKHMGTSIITSSVNSYTVELQKLSGTKVSETRTYNIDDECSFSSVQFFWLNQLGGIDQYTFKGHQGEEVSVKKSTYRQPMNYDAPFQQNANSPGYNTVMYDSEIEQEMYVGTRCNAETADWLRELYMSNWVAIIDPDLDEFIPVRIMDQSAMPYDSKKTKYTMSVAYQYAFDLQSQLV